MFYYVFTCFYLFFFRPHVSCDYGTKKVVSMTLTTCKVVTYVYYEMSKQLFGLSNGH